MTATPHRILGAVLAGGKSSRFGSDKGEATLLGRSLLERTREALEEVCADVVICGDSRPSHSSATMVLPDYPEPDLGPLGGLCAALRHARDQGCDAVLSAPVDAHPVPDILVELARQAGPCVIAAHWLFGIWPSTLADELEAHLRARHRSVLSWVDRAGASRIELRGPPPVNANTPAILAKLESGLALGAAVETHPVRELFFDTGALEDTARIVPVETPVAIEFNGINYAVMMATPTDLEDFVAGFACAEGLARPGEIEAVQVLETGGGWLARANLPERSMPRILERARTRVSESSCGICGIDSIAAALAPLEPIAAVPKADPAAIHRALEAMRSHQQVGHSTGAVHAAAFCTFDGEIVVIREDVGRHNALDKLIGAMGRDGLEYDAGFVLLSARCSQELVEKTVRAGIPMLVTISAPSSLAIARAREGRLTLLALARSDTALVVNDPHRLFGKSRKEPAENPRS